MPQHVLGVEAGALRQSPASGATDHATYRGAFSREQSRSGETGPGFVWSHAADVRLPLVELSDQSRVELECVLARMCDEYSEYMIGSVQEHSAAEPRVAVG